MNGVQLNTVGNGYGIVSGAVGNGSGVVGLRVINRWSIAPIIDINSMNVSTADGYIKNDAYTGVASANLFPFSTGDIATQVNSSNSGTVTTLRYAIGDYGLQTAMRAVITSTGANRYVGFAQISLAAGTYTFSAKVKSNTGLGNQTIKIGNLVGTLTTHEVNELSYTKISCTMTFASTTSPYLVILATSNVDILIDELQLYVGAETPTYSYLDNDTHITSVVRGVPRFSKVGNVIDFTNSLSGGVKLTSFPNKQTISEMTVMAVVSTTDTAGQATKIISSDGGHGVYDIGVEYGRANGKPALPKEKCHGLEIANKGYHILTSRFKVGEQAFFFNDFKHSKTTSTLSLSKSTFGAFGDTYVGTYPFKGKLTEMLVFDKWLSDDEVLNRVAYLKKRHISTLEAPVISTFNIWICEGDSISDSSFGDNYYRKFFVANTKNVFGKSSAVAGSALNTCTARLPFVLEQIEQAISRGHSPILSILIGANGIPLIADLITYWTACRNAGAKVIAATVLPRGGGDPVAFNIARNALNTQIRDSSAYYDGLFDFAADPTIGVDSAYLNATYYPDTIHPSSAGHIIMQGIATPVVDGLLV